MKQRMGLVFGIIAGILLLAVFYGAFMVTPMIVTPKAPDGVFSQKMFYFHVPIALTSFVASAIGAIAAILFLVKKERKYDFISYSSVQLALLFGFLVEWTGIIWTRMEWGAWWAWEPRLTTYLIFMLVYAGYFVLRSSVSDENARARYCAVYAIIAAINTPLSFFSIRLIPAVHPVVFTTSGASMETSMLVTFLIGMAGMTCLFISLLITRTKTESLKEEVDYLKNIIGG
ncbi:MAG: cytochrome c biogenesis protein CcsA [Actinobacteria bacterium]|nr:cytochrome c biogenesis protein CcsA [Actinomycetota bacterium]